MTEIVVSRIIIKKEKLKARHLSHLHTEEGANAGFLVSDSYRAGRQCDVRKKVCGHPTNTSEDSYRQL